MGPRIREDNGRRIATATRFLGYARNDRWARGLEADEWRFPNRPYEGLVAQHITGDHKGRPYRRRNGGVGDGGWVPACARTTGRGSRGGAARFPNRPYEGLVAQHITGDHKGRPYRGRNGRVGEGGWVPASARTTGRGSRGGARFPNRPYEGLVAQHITGDHKGRPYGRNGRGRGMGPRIREDDGKGESGGGRAVPEPPLRGVGRTAYNGRPQGSPLREKDGGVGCFHSNARLRFRAPTRPRPLPASPCLLRC